MKSPRFVGQMLALCLPGLAVGLAAFPSGAIATPSAPIVIEELSIYHQEDTLTLLSVIRPEVTQVRLSIQSGYLEAPPGATTYEILHAALSGDFGTQLVESSTPIGYRLVWDPETETWKLHCYELLNFTVDFGSQGHVVVEVFSRTILG